MCLTFFVGQRFLSMLEMTFLMYHILASVLCSLMHNSSLLFKYHFLDFVPRNIWNILASVLEPEDEECMTCNLIHMGSSMPYSDNSCPQCGRDCTYWAWKLRRKLYPDEAKGYWRPKWSFQITVWKLWQNGVPNLLDMLKLMQQGGKLQQDSKNLKNRIEMSDAGPRDESFVCMGWVFYRIEFLWNGMKYC